MNQTWSLLGPKLSKPAPSWTLLVFALLIAFETFVEVSEQYPLYMSLGAIAGSVYAFMLGMKKKALIAFGFLPLAAIWFLPIFGWDGFTSLSPTFFLPHALLAILFAIAGYTYAASEQKK